jgi:hypothetical protein
LAGFVAYSTSNSAADAAQLVGKVKNSYATTNVTVVTNTGGDAGGLIGRASIVEDSYATGAVSIYRGIAGGLIGTSYTTGTTKEGMGSIERCYATGSVTITAAKATSTTSDTAIAVAGGLYGFATYGIVKDCFTTGAVTVTTTETASIAGYSFAGGIAGLINATAGELHNCYTISTVTVTDKTGSVINIGGIAGAFGATAAFNKPDAITYNAVLNPASLTVIRESVATGTTRNYRVLGHANATPNYSATNVVYAAMQPQGEDTTNNKNGKDVGDGTEIPINSDLFFSTEDGGLGWSSTDWEWDSSLGRPIIKSAIN